MNPTPNPSKKPTPAPWAPSKEAKVVGICLYILFTLFFCAPLLMPLWNASLR